jgi:hypothetical protein
MSIYGSPAYAMGATQISLGVTPSEHAKAEIEVRKMRASLQKWLKYRSLLGVSPSDLSATELRLGKKLYALLSEMFDAQTLPSQTSVVALAELASAGKLPSEAQTPSAQGMIFLWPLVAVVGLVMLTIVTKIKSDADDAADERRTQCVMAGKCTDYGFWLKAGGVALIAWIAWDKFGLKKVFRE